MTNLGQRRAEAEAEVQHLKAKRGALMLDGRDAGTETARINRLEIELDALTEAEGALAERQRAEAEAKRLARLGELRSELAGLEEQRLEAIEMAELSARNLVDAINKALAANKVMAKLAHQISGTAAPMPMHQPDFVSRLSGRISGLLASIKGHGFRFGGFTWFSQGLYPASQNWAEREVACLKAHIEPLIAGAKPRPKEQLLQIEKGNHENGIDGNNDDRDES